MKKIIAIFIVLAGVMTQSCHRKQPMSGQMSCCSKDAAAAVPPSAATSTVPPSAASAPVPSATSTIPSPLQTSVYQLPGIWTDQHNHTLQLSDLKGKIRVMAMIFTHCSYACPRIVQDMKSIEDTLSDAEKSHVGFVLVSFDARRDDPAQLAHYAAQQGLDDHWTLLHGTPGQIRELSMLLNVRYENTADDNFTHSNVILILDSQGTIIKTLEGLQPQTALAGSVISQLVIR